MPPRRHCTIPFLKTHALNFGVQPCRRVSGSDGLVISAECLFWVYFGCKQKPGSKHARTANTKHSIMRGGGMLNFHIINALIVNTIIEEILWDPGGIHGQTHAMMMMHFEDISDESENLGEGKMLTAI
eukprot:4068170-Ditylum_brightwellii.AAC.1